MADIPPLAPACGETMTAAVPTAEGAAPGMRVVASLWARHLLSLYFPLNSLVFLWTAPHSWWAATLFMIPLVLAHQLDTAALREERQPPEALPAWPFDALVYALAGLQLLVIAALLRLFAVQGAGQAFFSFDMLMVFLVVGSSSGFSIVTAHELIHRRGTWEQRLGRLLLCSVLYEHFYTEHLRGHHVRVGTPGDPATARFGEGYETFFRRTVPAQLRSAWRLEKKRLGDPEMGLFDRRMLRSRVLHGLVLEWGVALAIFAALGSVAGFALLLQAFAAVRLLEAVNYFEHWGLLRRERRVQPRDSWDTHSWFTYYALIGLTRHADHHAAASRPYQALRVREEAPLLPFGYVGTIDLVMGRNAEYQALAAEELGRRRLGPFAPAGEGEAGAPVPPEAARERLVRAGADERREHRIAGGLLRAWLRVPLAVRRGLALGTVVLATAAGVHWEGDAASIAFPARLGLHAWILVSFVLALTARRPVAARLGEPLSWAFVFAVLTASGLASELLFS
jgi:alkane 1-monooxygenase